jgi:putative transposase
MKRKRYTTETKIRILREAQSIDRTIQDVCRERQISEQSFHRWKRELGMLELNQAKQLKELQRENARLKRMLADEMLGKELLGGTWKKVVSPGHKRQMAEKLVSGDRCTARAACRHFGLHRSTYAYRAKEADA